MTTHEITALKEAEVLLDLSLSTQPKGFNTTRSGYINQILVSCVAILGLISTGFVIGFSSVALPQLTAHVNETADQISLTPDQASWFASLATISSPIGCLVSGPIADRFGRKTTLLLLNLPSLLGWLLLATVTTNHPNPIVQLYCGRVFSGLAMGMASIPSTIYMAEVASNTKLRGVLLAWSSTSITLGILVVFIMGAIFRDSWQTVAALCGVLPIITLLLTYFFVPESPLWLVSKNKPVQALRSLKILRGVKGTEEVPLNVRLEHDALLEAQREKDKLANGDGERIDKQVEGSVLRKFYVSTCDTLRALRRPDSLKALFIMNGLFVFQQLSGYIVIVYYAVDVLLTAGVSVDPYLASILLGVVQLLSGIVVSFVMTRCGRRPLNITGGAGLTASMIALGLNVQFGIFGSWFPLLGLTSLVVFSVIGFRTVPWAILGEIYPLDIKGVAAGITTCTVYIASFITVKLYPLLAGMLNSTERVFYFYGAFSLVGTLFAVVFQPETHNKTLDQIQLELNSKRKSKKNVII